MRLREILHGKGRDIRGITPEASLEQVVQELVRHNIGSLIVFKDSAFQDDSMVGIVTERDVLKAQAQNSESYASLTVLDVMTSNPATGSPDTGLQEAMWLMTNRRFRHLPVVEQGKLLGIISIGDIVKAHHDMLEMENHFMKSYIQGEGADIGTPSG